MLGIDYKVRSKESDASSLVAARKASAHSTENESGVVASGRSDALGSTSLTKACLHVDAAEDT